MTFKARAFQINILHPCFFISAYQKRKKTFRNDDASILFPVLNASMMIYCQLTFGSKLVSSVNHAHYIVSFFGRHTSIMLPSVRADLS